MYRILLVSRQKDRNEAEVKFIDIRIKEQRYEIRDCGRSKRKGWRNE